MAQARGGAHISIADFSEGERKIIAPALRKRDDGAVPLAMSGAGREREPAAVDALIDPLMRDGPFDSAPRTQVTMPGEAR